MENRKRTPLAALGEGRWTESQAMQLLDEWRASGEPLAPFARQRGLVPQRLAWWRKRLGRRVESGPAGAPAFVPVTLRADSVSAEVSSPAAAIDLGAGLRVELRNLDATSAEWVALLARALDGGS